jgi:hypothetical protein
MGPTWSKKMTAIRLSLSARRMSDLGITQKYETFVRIYRTETRDSAEKVDFLRVFLGRLISDITSIISSSTITSHHTNISH